MSTVVNFVIFGTDKDEFKAQVKKIYQLEEKIAQFNNKWPIHQKKWGKYIEVET